MYGSEKYRSFLKHPGFNGSKGGGGSTTQKTSNEPWKEVQPYLKEGYERASDLYAPGEGPQYYPGQTYAPTDPLTTEARRMSEYYARNQMGQDVGAIRGAYGQTIGSNPLMEAFSPNNPYSQFIGNNELLKAIDIENNPYFGHAVNAAIRPITEQLTEQALPAIRSGAVQTGQYGGSRQALAEGTAIGKATRAMGDMAGTMASNAYGQGLNAYNQGLGAVQNLYSQNIGAYDRGVNNLQRSLGMAPEMLGISQAPASALGQLGQAYEGDTQKVIDSAGQRFGYNQTLPYNMLSDYMALLNGNNFGTQKTTGASQSGGSGLMGGLGAMLSLASLF